MSLPKGFKHSEKTKEKLRIMSTGRKHTNEARKKISERFKGNKHPNWKGGKPIKKEGYILIYSPEHPHRNNGNYVLEHRLVIEKQLGRYLTPEETVHHINENNSDNRIENLMLFQSRGKHTNFHRYIRREI